MRRPRFTIVTPVLNGMPWLPEAVRSIVAQGRDVDVEHIVLDGGSTDGSREWLEANAAPGTILVFERDTGQTDALIRGFARASGEILSWLNADDTLEPGALARVAEAFDSNPEAVLVAGACLHIDSAGAVIGAIPTPPSSTLEGLLAHPYNIAQPSSFVRAGAYRAVGGLDPTLRMAMDVDLWMKLARIGRVVLLPGDVLSRFRIHGGAKSVAGASRAVREDLRVRRRYGMAVPSRTWWTLFKQAYLRPVKRLRLR